MSSNHVTSAECFGQRSSGQLGVEPHVLRPESARNPQELVLLGQSAAVQRLRSQIGRIAPYFRIALIRGETGCGKELIARAIHARSPGADGPFVVTHAATLAESLAAGDLARTGRRWTPAAMLRSADSGTLYLRGAGELSFSLQATLLQFLRECNQYRGRVSRTNLGRGDSSGRPGDLRILAASSRDLRTLAAIGQFRQDLYAHLAVVEIVAPPLRQRTEDIPLLAEWFLGRVADRAGQAPKLLVEETVLRLQKHLWPNNLREFERVVCQAAELAEGAVIEPRHLLTVVEQAFASCDSPPVARTERLHDVMQQHVFEVLKRYGGNKQRAAELLGISRSTLYRMLDAGKLPRR